MTYAQLLEHGCIYLEAEGVSRQQVKNLASALRLWIRTHGFIADKVVADEFSSDFNKFFGRFSDFIAETLAPRTQKDRQEQLLRWRRIADALRMRDTLPKQFSAALWHCLSMSPLTKKEIAKDCGISYNNLRLWSMGTVQPMGKSIQVVTHLEKVLELSEGTLVGRLPLARHTRYLRGKVKPDVSTTFSKLRKAQRAALPRYAMQLTPRLKSQWVDLLRMKTDPMRDEARARNTWRIGEARHAAPCATSKR